MDELVTFWILFAFTLLAPSVGETPCWAFHLVALFFISSISVWVFFSTSVFLQNPSLMSCVSVLIGISCLCFLRILFKSLFYSLSSLNIHIRLLSYFWDDFIQFTFIGCHYYRVVILKELDYLGFSCYLCVYYVVTCTSGARLLVEFISFLTYPYCFRVGICVLTNVSLWSSLWRILGYCYHLVETGVVAARVWVGVLTSLMEGAGQLLPRNWGYRCDRR